ncbi:aspartyl/asparaginyl beta-hydroxylase domain-containing protein [Pseudomonas gingeri]|uniref:Aspartyl/asparaginyl beta-hydroxylase domain-containing protein n=1 Tax=Pseudomonas gingeri TaxID=117681 RepID=A0A7Y7X731_9PSED|nr:aspartyl/asparaginyl beta-hydroxylase domain-containing protein [Pseudomonas gingeri]NWB94439.1 aspartyl/asparaginyl beta-hydroxylase domain-containing protein [Pseudomonas gingeri]
MSRPAFSRLPVALDLPLLRQALAQLDESAWVAHFNLDYYAGEWSGVALVSASDAPGELASGKGEAVARKPWLEDARWSYGLQGLPLEIRSARLLRLGPGGRIHEHRDYDLSPPDADRRLHIPLLSPPDVEFMLDGQCVPMKAGECWFLDLARPHSVDNWGDSERVHLVLDCRPSPWLEQQIAAGLPTTPAPGLGRAAVALEQFRQWLERDPQLCRELQAQTDSETFIAHTLERATAHGLHFTREDLRAAMSRGRRSWSQAWTA